MKHYLWIVSVCCALCCLCLGAHAQEEALPTTPSASAAEEGRPFHSLYLDAVVDDLTGFSTVQQYTVGVREGQRALYLAVKNTTSNTQGSQAIYQYAIQGVTVTGGLRYYFPRDRWYAFASYGRGVSGDSKGIDDIRLGVAGYDEWLYGENRVFDLYGDITWVGADEDLYATIRARDGKILSQHGNTRWWVYGVGYLTASASGDNGISNRIEIGPGLGYRTYKAPFGMTVSLEPRIGYSFSGAIEDKFFFNPTLIVAGGF